MSEGPKLMQARRDHVKSWPILAKSKVTREGIDYETRITQGPGHYRLEYRESRKGARWQHGGRIYSDLETAKMDLVRLRFSK